MSALPPYPPGDRSWSPPVSPPELPLPYGRLRLATLADVPTMALVACATACKSLHWCEFFHPFRSQFPSDMYLGYETLLRDAVCHPRTFVVVSTSKCLKADPFIPPYIERGIEKDDRCNVSLPRVGDEIPVGVAM